MSTLIDRSPPKHSPVSLQPVLPEHLQRVLLCLLHGMRNSEVAEELNISANTLKGYRSNLIGRFGVQRIEQVIAKAARLGRLDELPDKPRGS